MIKMFFKKTVLLALVAALGLASLPFFSVSAQGLNDPQPPAGQVSNEKLEKAWAHQVKLYEKMGKTDEFVAKTQKLIDRAKTNGKDVVAVQSALDAFKLSAKNAQPIYESIQSIVNTHEGFDANGKVTDPEKAKATIQAMHEKMQAIKTAMDGTGKALRDALKAFRSANPRPEKTPKP